MHIPTLLQRLATIFTIPSNTTDNVAHSPSQAPNVDKALPALPPLQDLSNELDPWHDSVVTVELPDGRSLDIDLKALVMACLNEVDSGDLDLEEPEPNLPFLGSETTPPPSPPSPTSPTSPINAQELKREYEYDPYQDPLFTPLHEYVSTGGTIPSLMDRDSRNLLMDILAVVLRRRKYGKGILSIRGDAEINNNGGVKKSVLVSDSESETDSIDDGEDCEQRTKLENNDSEITLVNPTLVLPITPAPTPDPVLSLSPPPRPQSVPVDLDTVAAPRQDLWHYLVDSTTLTSPTSITTTLPKQESPKLPAPTPTNPTSTRRIKLLMSVQELIETERAYLKDLQHLIEGCFDSLNAASWLPIKKRLVLVRNAKELLSFQQLFAKHLLETLSPFLPTESDMNNINTLSNLNLDSLADTIGSCFIAFHDQFHVYTHYCTQHDGATQILRDYESHPAMMAILTKFQQITGQRKLDLRDYIIKPVQRICKYPLILKEIRSHSGNPQNGDSNIDSAIKQMSQIAADIDMAKWYLDNLKKTDVFCERMLGVYFASGSGNAVVTKSVESLGRILASDAVGVKFEDGRMVYLGLFLFHTTLLFIKPRKPTTYTLKRQLHLHDPIHQTPNYQLELLPTTTTLFPSSIRITALNSKSTPHQQAYERIDVSFANDNARNTWVEILSSILADEGNNNAHVSKPLQKSPSMSLLTPPRRTSSLKMSVVNGESTGTSGNASGPLRTKVAGFIRDAKRERERELSLQRSQDSSTDKKSSMNRSRSIPSLTKFFSSSSSASQQQLSQILQPTGLPSPPAESSNDAQPPITRTASLLLRAATESKLRDVLVRITTESYLSVLKKEIITARKQAIQSLQKLSIDTNSSNSSKSTTSDSHILQNGFTVPCISSIISPISTTPTSPTSKRHSMFPLSTLFQSDNQQQFTQSDPYDTQNLSNHSHPLPPLKPKRKAPHNLVIHTRAVSLDSSKDSSKTLPTPSIPTSATSVSSNELPPTPTPSKQSLATLMSKMLIATKNKQVTSPSGIVSPVDTSSSSNIEVPESPTKRSLVKKLSGLFVTGR